ncbi:hypothetical protein [Candidatus Palauibacter sp.]|uniref:hypothetical protein n=1 Tax=Candidatus Palauibacter sp. TaxID=3101350 RepID=UPI003CC6679F
MRGTARRRASGEDRPVHFGLIVTLNLGIGQQTPPVASVLVTYAPAIPLALVNVFYH